jgi:hypothetical protein
VKDQLQQSLRLPDCMGSGEGNVLDYPRVRSIGVKFGVCNIQSMMSQCQSKNHLRGNNVSKSMKMMMMMMMMTMVIR